MTNVFNVVEARGAEVPILLSVPHCGTRFPEELSTEFKPELAAAPDDTDWFVDKLYSFAPDLGIAMISATYSRWVIDLNRDPESKPLYHDGRIITALCPTTTFVGESLYIDARKEVEGLEINRRLDLYYWPYHLQLVKMLDNLRDKFGHVLLWDCHSIRQRVPSIYPKPFPDLILGDADGTSASPGLIEAALGTLDHDQFEVSHNHPFKGGYITRHFGKPTENQHALQLEMTKLNYMDDEEKNYDARRAERMQDLLKKTFRNLIERL